MYTTLQRPKRMTVNWFALSHVGWQYRISAVQTIQLQLTCLITQVDFIHGNSALQSPEKVGGALSSTQKSPHLLLVEKGKLSSILLKDYFIIRKGGAEKGWEEGGVLKGS